MTGMSSDAQYWLPYQHASAPAQFAMFTRAYMHRYGLTEEDLGMVAINQRDNAVRNPAAMMRQPLSMDEYLGSRWIYEPLRLFDCCIESDAAVALVVTSSARSRDTRRRAGRPSAPPHRVGAVSWRPTTVRISPCRERPGWHPGCTRRPG